MKIQHRLHLSLAASAVICLPQLHAQDAGKHQQAAAPTVQSAVGAISLPVTVVNDKGDPVKNLTASSVTLTDDGRPQTIQSFSIAQPAPMSIGLIAQTSSDMRYELGDERLAGVHFIDHTIPGTDDKFFLIQYGKEVDLLADPTGTENKLHDAIAQLGSPQPGSQGSGSDQQSGSERRAGGYGGTLYDAIYLACTEVLKQQPGRHILIVITDGVDRGSKESLNDAIDAAQSTNTMVFSIYYKGEVERENPNPVNNRRGGMGPGFPGGGGYPGGGGGYPGGRRGGEQTPSEPPVDGRKILEQLGNATGGYMVEGRHDKAEDAYNKIGALLKNQYTLSWAPDKDSASSGYHRLTLTTKEKGVYPLVQQNYTAHP